VAFIECANCGKASHVVNEIFRRRNGDITREAGVVVRGREDSQRRILPELARGHDHTRHKLTDEIQSGDQVFAKGSLSGARFRLVY